MITPSRAHALVRTTASTSTMVSVTVAPGTQLTLVQLNAFVSAENGRHLAKPVPRSRLILPVARSDLGIFLCLALVPGPHRRPLYLSLLVYLSRLTGSLLLQSFIFILPTLVLRAIS